MNMYSVKCYVDSGVPDEEKAGEKTYDEIRQKNIIPTDGDLDKEMKKRLIEAALSACYNAGVKVDFVPRQSKETESK